MGEKKKQRLAEAEAKRTLALMPEMPDGDDTKSAVPPAEPVAAAETAPSAHPEEMKASVSLRIGETISLTATARATPAGLVASALITAAVMVPLIWISRRR
ncbi:hypothetical protein ACELLULO517_07170 [Acidisoma cellulosilytica]|uniref:Uncharacterized protein n=1 Tax=Acidisoma cellulosilyticum TaxID=2802395 RepID=A0A963YZM4_9PROT|nr:hypothetical protein [Acidisoma cellulosilyticum]MCB8880009.1 hypothetical protein [Acidisoma cellulosilyticum]